MRHSSSKTRQLTKADFKVPLLLVLLSIIPTFGGILRLLSVARHAAVTPDNARFLHAPVPVVIHIFSATLFCVLGAFQFSRGFRLRWPGLHRRAGRVLALCGLAVGATGLWMATFYEIPTSLQGPLLYGVRLAVATAMTAFIIVAWRSILRRDVARHEAFMIRAYALAQGAGTQALVLLPPFLISGVISRGAVGLTRDILMSVSWVINLVVAEGIIRRRRSPRIESTGREGIRLSAELRRVSTHISTTTPGH
jgi:hypothetical protein